MEVKYSDTVPRQKEKADFAWYVWVAAWIALLVASLQAWRGEWIGDSVAWLALAIALRCYYRMERGR